MSERIKAFGTIIPPNSFVEGDQLVERDQNGKVIMNVKLRFRNIDDWLIWRYDPNEGDLFPFFANGINGLKSICDFFLLAERNGKQYLCVLELKSSSSSAKKQLDASKLLAEYLISSAKRISLDIGNPCIVKIRIVRGKPTTKYREPEYENDCGYISYRLPVTFDVKLVLDVYDRI